MTSADDAPAQRSEPGGIRAVSRALDVLDCFENEGQSLAVSDIVRRCELPRTTVLRLVDTLVGERMLQLLPDGRVSVGPRMIRWGAFAKAAWSAPAATLDRLRELAEQTGETVSLYVRRDLKRVAIAQAPGRHTIRHVVQVGDKLPIWLGAASTTLLSGERPEALDAVLAQLDADESIDIDTAALRRRVDEIREQGWGLSHGERESGNSGLAMLVPENPDRPHLQPVVVVLGGPTARFVDARIPEFVDALRACVRDVPRTGLPPALE
ncbi:IclR family transcriptional regulator [Pseudoclavibacter sp. JSM 162008]|uniref:IclR family transcriptional regulator n=1 Tax=Pseudoclavibacter sp. JSM 162008 TaxID=3229855 RepID=UPI003523B7C5